jgi:8-oxo-dGTP pyrophosphatase MutT (NUDIX family)
MRPAARFASLAPPAQPIRQRAKLGQVSSEEQWRATRRYLTQHRHELTLAASELYPDHQRVYGTPLLTRPEWQPPRPLPLTSVELELTASSAGAPVTGEGPESEDVRPLRPDGSRYPSYAAALGALSRPKLFENRACYRLLDAAHGATRLTFGRGRYFDMISTCEAAAHELAAHELADATLASHTRLTLRDAIGDPTDLTRRPVMTAISALVLRKDPRQTTMVLHWRDPAKVATSGDRYTVAPAGMFQPSDEAAHNFGNDFSLWRCLARELAEELRNDPEDYGSDTKPIDYDNWPFYQRLTEAGQQQSTYWAGLGVDPLSMVLDMLVITVFDAPLFDALFPGTLLADGGHPNDEGRLRAEPFTEQTVADLSGSLQPGSAALLRAAWHHRAALL